VRIQTIPLLIVLTVTATTSVSADPTTHTVPIDPKVAPLVKKAASEWELKQWDLAIRTCSEALQMKPDTITAAAIHSWRAIAYRHKNNLDKAMADANESIRLNPRYYGGYFQRGAICRQSGDLDQAIRCYDAAIRLNPNLAQTYYNRAIAYLVKGDYDQAIRDNTEAIQRQDKTMQADFYFNRAVSYQALGTFDKAMADYNDAIRLAPNDLAIYCGRADAFEKMGQLDKASADYDRAIRLHATEPNDYRLRGKAYFAKGDYRAAASDFEEAVRLSPSDYDAANSHAWFQATCPEDSLRNGKKALETSLRVCERSRWQDSGAVDTLAAAYAETGNFDAAVKYQTQAINMKGVHAFKRKRMQERLELYREHKPYRQESKLKPR
jgi:tetratricopeptide (TPR) repeat protein